MIALLGYGCSSSAGKGVASFWQSLEAGRHYARPAFTEGWPVVPSPIPTLCAWDKEIRESGAHEALVSQLLSAWQEANTHLGSDCKNEITKNLGVILASTKGNQEDFIWNSLPSRDPLTPVLDSFIQKAGLNPKRSLCVSNACASSHGALFLAKKWIEAKIVDPVLVIAADTAGPFVVNGFQSLKALSKDVCKPFSGDRDGIVLGDAAAALLLSSLSSPSTPTIEAINIENEGYAVTRPSQEGESLRRIYKKIGVPKNRPDLVIAHGTGTFENDKTEDWALGEAFKESPDSPPVTATKWCIGHTLGASGAMDLIAAAEVLRHQKIFSIGNTTRVDENFRMTYLCRGREWRAQGPLQRVLVNSLGFGGAHAALLLNSERT